MIERDISRQALKYLEWFPIVSMTGPRQSGKSTLVKNLFPDFEYLNLEDEGTYNLARTDPPGFIYDRPHALIIDEAQRVPELFHALQVASDDQGTPGQYVLSGSQNFLMLSNITQSLAGRVGLLKLLPFSYREALRARPELSVDEFMITGGYPRLYDASIPPVVYFENYLATYVQRDVAGLVSGRNLSIFLTFITLCAQACGSLLNVTRLARDVDVSRQTADSWLSILESSYILFRLQPYHANLRKRLTKAPKIYFYDTGLLCHLLGLKTVEQLRDSPMRGPIFENLVIVETIKRHLNRGESPNLTFYRDSSGIEVDMVDSTDPAAVELVEVKSARSFQPSFTKHLASVGDELNITPEHRYVVMRSQRSTTVSGTKIWSVRDWLDRE
ncbi:MAG: ATP-binding protein [Eggerthellaceae bacterium]|jgi:predicted AAA+ superfamily ATPase